MALTDKHGRTITDLRVSITDRCTYRCVYGFNEMAEILETAMASQVPSSPPGAIQIGG